MKKKNSIFFAPSIPRVDPPLSSTYEGSKKPTHLFAMTTFGGRDSSRHSAILFYNCATKTIENHAVYRGFHKGDINCFVKHCINKTVSINETRPTKQELIVSIPKNIANKSLLEGYSKNHLKFEEYKQSDPFLNDRISSLREDVRRHFKGKIYIRGSDLSTLVQNINNSSRNKGFTFLDGKSINSQKREYNTKASSSNKWQQYLYENKSTKIITKDVLWMAMLKFISIYKKNYGNKKFILLLKIKFPSGEIRSLSTAQIGSIRDYLSLLTVFFNNIFLCENIRTKTSDFWEDDFQENYMRGDLIFEFKPLDNNLSSKFEEYEVKEGTRRNVGVNEKPFKKLTPYNGFKIPSTMNLKLWPNIVFFSDNKAAIASIPAVERFLSNISLTIIVHDNYYEVIGTCEGRVVFKLKDTMDSSQDFGSFTREIVYQDKNKTSETYIFSKGDLVYYEKMKKVIFIKKKMIDKRFLSDSIITLDIETRKVNDKLIPICLSIYDGSTRVTFFFKDHINWENDMTEALKFIMKLKYHKKKIYIHNLSYFDGIFILNSLTKLGTVKPLMRDGKILNLEFRFKVVTPISKKDKEIVIYFYDSLLILPASLDNLSKSFGIKNKKTIFPFEFINSDKFSFDYSGVVPEYKYFPNAFTPKFTPNDYNNYCENYKDKNWVLEKELAKYCENDTIALHQIMIKFGQEVFALYTLDITRYPTLPSITMAAYRSRDLPVKTVPIINSRLHYILKEGYYGGITDTYRAEGKNIMSYDVNSLYPYSMHEFEMPVGTPVKFIGDPSLRMNNPFGFFKVTVTAPLNMNVPILPTKIETSKGQRTVCPVGTWTGWYFSEEIRNAEKYGYKFEIIEGYLFKKKKIFTKFISELYTIKSKLDSSDPRYFISKLFMNSLYGRFGMNPISEVTAIVSALECERIVAGKKNVNIIPLLSGKVLVTYEEPLSDELHITNISVPISAAIAAYSRIVMSHYLYKYSDNIYAMDTDGIKVDCPLNSSEVNSKELGKMKYEYTFKEAVFPAPKVYGGILDKSYKGKTEFTKIKGVKVPISFYQLKTVLDSCTTLKIKQEKWRREMKNSSILVNLEDYTLALTETKRELVLNSWGRLVGTIPLLLENGIVVKRNPPLLHYLPAPTKLLCLPAPEQFLYISAPDSYLALKAPIEEENIIYILPTVFYMGAPLPSVIHLPESSFYYIRYNTEAPLLN